MFPLLLFLSFPDIVDSHHLFSVLKSRQFLVSESFQHLVRLRGLLRTPHPVLSPLHLRHPPPLADQHPRVLCASIEQGVDQDIFVIGHIREQMLQVLIIRSGLKVQRFAVVQIGRELRRHVLTQPLHTDLHLHLHDLVVLLLLCVRGDTLPGKTALGQEDQDVAYGLHIVTSTLLDPDVCVDGGVAGGAGETFALSIPDMHFHLGVAELLAEAEVDHIQDTLLAFHPHQEVVGFDVAVDDILLVDTLDAVYHLVRQHHHRLQGKTLVNLLQVRQRLPEQLHHQDVLVSLGSVPVYLGESGLVAEHAQQPGLRDELRVIIRCGFDLHCDLLARGSGLGQVDYSEGAVPQFGFYFVFVGNCCVFHVHL